LTIFSLIFMLPIPHGEMMLHVTNWQKSTINALMVNFEVCLISCFSLVCFVYGKKIVLCKFFDEFFLCRLLAILVGPTCFENVCGCCHLPSMTLKIDGHYCYNCKNIAIVENQVWISYKIKQNINDEFYFYSFWLLN